MTAKQSKSLQNLIYSAVFLALAYVLPFLTGQIPSVGKMLLPMHLPALLCGFVCGWQWGLGVGFLAPLLRSLTLGMPPFFPMAVSMAFELAAYGAIAGRLRNGVAGDRAAARRHPSAGRPLRSAQALLKRLRVRKSGRAFFIPHQKYPGAPARAARACHNCRSTAWASARP